MPQSIDDRSYADLVSSALTQLKELIRSEIRLAKAELARNAGKAAVGIGMLAGALVFGIATVTMLLFAVAALLQDAGLPAGVSALLGVLLGAAAAGGLAWAGLQRLKVEALMPERTMRQLRRDGAAAKEQYR